MLSLYEQSNHANGTFFSLQPSGGSRIKIEDLLFDLQIPNQENPLEYHTTVIYSEKPCPAMKHFEIDLPIWGMVYYFDLFGPNKDILVLRVESKQIKELYKSLQIYEPTTNYPEYKPHITVAKDFKGELPKIHKFFSIKYDSYVVCAINKDD